MDNDRAEDCRLADRRLSVCSRFSSSVTSMTEKWDIYSMGLVFQEMFGLPNPLHRYVSPIDNPDQIYNKLLLASTIEPLTPDISPYLPQPMAKLIQACLQPRPEARPTAAQVEQYLIQMQRGAMEHPVQPIHDTGVHVHDTHNTHEQQPLPEPQAELLPFQIHLEDSNPERVPTEKTDHLQKQNNRDVEEYTHGQQGEWHQTSGDADQPNGTTKERDSNASTDQNATTKLFLFPPAPQWEHQETTAQNDVAAAATTQEHEKDTKFTSVTVRGANHQVSTPPNTESECAVLFSTENTQRISQPEAQAEENPHPTPANHLGGTMGNGRRPYVQEEADSLPTWTENKNQQGCSQWMEEVVDHVPNGTDEPGASSGGDRKELREVGKANAPELVSLPPASPGLSFTASQVGAAPAPLAAAFRISHPRTPLFSSTVAPEVSAMDHSILPRRQEFVLPHPSEGSLCSTAVHSDSEVEGGAAARSYLTTYRVRMRFPPLCEDHVSLLN
eukprot:GHVT01087480.1.p1 GENE.GHVT01087480.1~~GHVT01087480.1.p1  ORF type:complete len:501 (+),score=52.41 GHVT01087480.1:443-1945(+)